ncbi:hypothetical protein [Nocardia sp. NPDC047648]|uniref:hypothetical protein n=1 Tax=Nocardia sp. NPDC047648 TaxID=3155625 RepID=UPI003400AEC6
MTLEDVARDLYGLPPAQFVAARTDRAAAAKQAGDKRLAAAIGKLRKPTLTGWTANLLSRAAPDDVAALLRLGAALAAAQRNLSADELRDLTAQRQQLVNALAAKAGALAAGHGHPVGEGVVREVGQTLTAALAEPEVAERLRAGTLVTAASYEGFGPSGPDLVPVPEPAARPGRAAARPKQDDSARRELADAQDALENARATEESARSALEDAAGELSSVEERIAALRDELEHAEQQRQFRKSAERSAEDELRAARRQLERAERRVAKARQRAEDGRIS